MLLSFPLPVLQRPSLACPAAHRGVEWRVGRQPERLCSADGYRRCRWLAAGDRSPRSGAQLDDEAIEMRGSSRVSTALQNRGSVSVTSYNRVVLLTGQVFTQADRDLVENTARTLPNARYIVNEVSVGNLAASTPG